MSSYERVQIAASDRARKRRRDERLKRRREWLKHARRSFLLGFAESLKRRKPR